jgi:hypothetical protein
LLLSMLPNGCFWFFSHAVVVHSGICSGIFAQLIRRWCTIHDDDVDVRSVCCVAWNLSGQ